VGVCRRPCKKMAKGMTVNDAWESKYVFISGSMANCYTLRNELLLPLKIRVTEGCDITFIQ
jgi:hypothetical protein